MASKKTTINVTGFQQTESPIRTAASGVFADLLVKFPDIKGNNDRGTALSDDVFAISAKLPKSVTTAEEAKAWVAKGYVGESNRYEGTDNNGNTRVTYFINDPKKSGGGSKGGWNRGGGSKKPEPDAYYYQRFFDGINRSINTMLMSGPEDKVVTEEEVRKAFDLAHALTAEAMNKAFSFNLNEAKAADPTTAPPKQEKPKPKPKAPADPFAQAPQGEDEFKDLPFD